jgi:hypothetical protein
MAGVARGLRLNTASKPSSTSCLRVRNHGWAGLQSFDDPVVGPPFAASILLHLLVRDYLTVERVDSMRTARFWLT